MGLLAKLLRFHYLLSTKKSPFLSDWIQLGFSFHLGSRTRTFLKPNQKSTCSMRDLVTSVPSPPPNPKAKAPASSPETGTQLQVNHRFPALVTSHYARRLASLSPGSIKPDSFLCLLPVLDHLPALVNTRPVLDHLPALVNTCPVLSLNLLPYTMPKPILAIDVV